MKNELERLFADVEDPKERKRTIVKYLRAVQDEADPSQSFLFAAYLPVFYEMAKEELAND